MRITGAFSLSGNREDTITPGGDPTLTARSPAVPPLWPMVSP
jgi:hypothetical protein